MVIAKCICKHAFQDQRYGQGRRVHTPAGKDGGDIRCTVCGKINVTATPKKKTVVEAEDK